MIRGRRRRVVPRGRGAALAAAALGAGVTASSSAGAAGLEIFDFYVSPGVVFSGTSELAGAAAVGFEITAGYLPVFSAKSFVLPHAALLYRGTTYEGDLGEWGRRTFGGQLGIAPLGVELGYGWRDAVGTTPDAGGFHLSPFLSAGAFYLGPEWLFPSSGGPPEVAFNVGLKLPLPQAVGLIMLGATNWDRMGRSGRPLRIDGRDWLAAPVAGASWRAGSASAGDLGAAASAALAAHWTAEARLEHASIAAFAKLALELIAEGAPPGLTDGAQAAARDEIRHARTCFALASAYGGRAIDPGPLSPPPFRTRRGLAAIVAESLEHGCLGEGLAAAEAELAAERCLDDRVRAALETIAADEASHQALAWAVVDWAVSRSARSDGRRAMRDALRESARRFGAVVRQAASAEASGHGGVHVHGHAGELEAHGVVGGRARAVLAGRVAAACLARLERVGGLLARSARRAGGSRRRRSADAAPRARAALRRQATPSARFTRTRASGTTTRASAARATASAAP